MEKIIMVGRDGSLSLKGVFTAMQSESNLVINAKKKNTNEDFFKLYTEPSLDDFKKVNNLSLSNSIIIQWGTRVSVPKNNCIVYNNSKAIASSSDKYLARQIFQKDGVNIPKLVDPSNFELEDLPIIARPFRHRQGKNFVQIKDYGSFENFYNKNKDSWYFSTYINKDAEYRAHVAHGRILSLMKKPKPEDSSILAWNHANVEEAFEAVKWSEWDMDLCKTALRACKALNLDFAALDLITYEGIPYVLEANTCPSLTSSEYNTEKYAKYFDWLLRKDELREHWEFEDKKKAASLAWKNWMFEDRQPNELSEN